MRISVKDTISESYYLFRKNFKVYLCIVLFFFIYEAFTGVYTYFVVPLVESFYESMNSLMPGLTNGNISTEALMDLSNAVTAEMAADAMVLVNAALISFVLIVVFVVFLPRLILTTCVLAKSQLDASPMTLKEAYASTKGKYWLTVWCSLLMALFLIPTIPLSASGAAGSAIIAPLYSAVINAVFYVVIPMIALEPVTGKYLRRSISFLRGNYWESLALTLILTTALSLVYYFLATRFGGNAQTLLIIDLAYSLLAGLLVTMRYISTVLVYRKLQQNPQA